VDWSHWLEIVGRSAAIYAVVLIGLRLGGRRELAQLEPFDLVVILLVANAVQNAMVGSDVTLAGGIVSAATLLAINYGVSAASTRWRWFRRAVEGQGRVIVEDGHLVDAALKREHLLPDDVERILQSRLDVPTQISDIKRAVLEVDGSVSVVRKDDSIERSNSRLPSRRFRRRYRPVS
jgi:uncharacterized membrane protein YcaP (DUF421 family)